MDEEGFLFITGRASDMYISGGSNVYPRETEEKVLAHPSVAEVAIVGVPDTTWGEVGVAVCVLKAGARLGRGGAPGLARTEDRALQATEARLLLGRAAEVRLRQDRQEDRPGRARGARLPARGAGLPRPWPDRLDPGASAVRGRRPSRLARAPFSVDQDGRSGRKGRRLGPVGARRAGERPLKSADRPLARDHRALDGGRQGRSANRRRARGWRAARAAAVRRRRRPAGSSPASP